MSELDFDQLYDRHALEVYRYIARRHIGNDSQDLTGDVFLIALQKMDSIPVADIRRFESEFLEFISRERKQIFEVISTTRELSDDTAAALTEAITAFKTQFKSSVAQVVNEKKADALSGEDNEQITRQVPAKK